MYLYKDFLKILQMTHAAKTKHSNCMLCVIAPLPLRGTDDTQPSREPAKFLLNCNEALSSS